MNKQKLWIIISVVFIVFFVAAVFVYGKLTESYTPNIPDDFTIHTGSGSEQTNRPSDGSGDSVSEYAAPDFTVYDADGNAVSLSDLKGKPVIVNFWATWCGPCKSELPSFDEAYAKYGDKVHFMMVNMTDGQSETVDGVKKFVSDNGFTFPTYYDTDLDAAYTYGVNSIPMTYFIMSNGDIATGYLGMIPHDTLFAYIDTLLELEEEMNAK